MENPIRSCANCACNIMQKHMLNPLEQQMFCRREPPTAAQMRGETPRIRDGKPVMDKHTGKPIMESVQQLVYLYKPVTAESVCFDGWRPEGTLPGERAS